MALNKEQKQEFAEKLTDFKVYLDDLKKESNLFKSQLRKDPRLEPYYQIVLSVNAIKMINTCLLVNDLSVAILDIKK
nr:Uncharacterized protein A9P81_0100 [Leptospira interrogans serovar Copenhageni/Icterohaemorrhagiae]